MLPVALQVDYYHFRYPQANVLALKGLNFGIDKGEVVALLGHNGAGKSTLIKCLLGLLAQDSGKILWEGISNSRPDQKEFGVCFENTGTYRKAKAIEWLEYCAGTYGLKNWRERVEYLAASLDFGSFDKTFEKMSAGQCQKVHIIRSLMHQPKWIFWDEATMHLDPLSQIKAIDLLHKEVKAQNGFALFSSHHLVQVEQSEKFLFLHQGEQKFFGTWDDLENLPRPEQNTKDEIYAEIELGANREPAEKALILLGFQKISERQNTSANKSKFVFLLPNSLKSLNELIILLTPINSPILSLRLLTPTLNDYYTEFCGGMDISK